MDAVPSGKGERFVFWRPSRWIGWFGLAQGVCSRNCCSELVFRLATAAAAEVAEELRDVVV